MDVNADFSKRVMLHADEIAWESSPMPGVQRRRLDRVGENDERVTTLVRYAPKSRFSPHVHIGGEELIVLEGVFEDDYGHWETGSYIRNPPQSKHTPGSAPGCTILVKLGQFAPEDQIFIHANIYKLPPVPHRDRPGVAVTPLYADEREEVRVEYWAAGQHIEVKASGGAEIFVLSGGFNDGNDLLRQYSWLRLPVDSTLYAETDWTGATVWIKSGHLRYI